MSFGLARLAREPVEWEAKSGHDGQGKSTFADPVTIHVRVTRRDEVIKGRGGEDIKTMAMVWVPVRDADQDLPNYDDRITCQDGLVGIVVERIDGKTIQSNVLGHIRLRLRS